MMPILFRLRILVLLLALCPASALAMQSGRIVVVGDKSNAPFEFLDENGQPTGMLVDMWRLWSAKTGVRVDYRLTEWSETMNLVREGRADAVSDIYYTPERAQTLDFTEPYLEVPASLFFHRDLSGITGLKDLSGFRVGVLKDDYAEYFLRKNHPNLTLVTYSTFATLIDAAVAGEIKVFVADIQPALYHLARHGAAGNVYRRVERPLYVSAARSAVRKGDTATLNLIRSGRDRLTRTEIEEVQKRWQLGQTASTPPAKTILGVLVILACGAALLFVSNRILRRKFASATEDLALTKAELDAKERLADWEERKFKKLVDTMNDGFLVHDGTGRITYVNDRICKMLGYTREEVLGMHVTSFVEQNELPDLSVRLGKAQTGQRGTFEMTVRTKAGELVQTLISSSPLSDAEGGQPGTLCIVTDVGQLKQADALLRAEREKYLSIFENALEGIFQMDLHGVYLNVNPSFARIMGCRPGDGHGPEACRDKAMPYLEPGRREEFLLMLQEKDVVSGFESQVVLDDGSHIWVSENARVVRDAQGRPLYYEGFLEDITKRKRAEELLAHQAFHDTLTNLPNRALFLERLSRAIMRSRRRDNYQYAVIYMDLDRFKIINDSLGHSAGDELIQITTQRIMTCIRTLDTLARIGGDEFAVLLEEIDSAKDCIHIARRIRDEIKKPARISGHDIFNSASMGIVLGPTGYDLPEEILRDADIAMYRAKDLGKDRFKVFHSKMHVQILSRMNMETELRQGIAAGEFFLLFQPIVNLRKGTLKGFEALVRWQHPVRGLVPPSEFVHLAEETGLIVPLGAWVFQEACRSLAEFRTRFPTISTLTMSINLSPKQFAQPDLARFIATCMRDYALPPGSLVLEITEGVIMENPQAATAILRRLKDAGLRVGMDDFGTGYSSLSYLHQFPVDLLKIDRSFVNRMDRDPEQLAMVRTIVQLAHILNMEVVAEGIEVLEQLVHLLKLECEYAQGYYFSTPQSIEALSERLHIKNGLLTLRTE